MAVRFLQANLNHASQAQNLFYQSLAERGIGLAIVAEPYKIPAKLTWLGNARGTAAIKSPALGESRQDTRGTTLVRWVNSVGLHVINEGRVSTCVRPQEESIVDITIGSKGAKRMVRGWRVVGDSRGETFSDHQYIEFVLDAVHYWVHHPPRGGDTGRWTLTKLDPKKLEEALMTILWGIPEGEERRDINLDVEWLRGVMREESTLNWGPGLGGPYELEEDEEISSNELQRAVKRIRSRKAPGPDGVLGKIWVWALDFLGERLRYIFNKCLRHGAFPQQWKQAKLVLLPKEGKEEGTPSAYRPICLLDEVSKIFERIIANRLVRHISREGGLHEEQYGFRAGRSTVDAISRVTSLTEEAVEGGGVALAVLLDIANAFNTLPWDREPGVRHTRRTPMPTGNSMRGSAGVSLRTPTVESHIQPSPLPSSPSWLPRHLLCRRHISAGRGEQLGDTAAKAETAVAAVVQSITGMGLGVAAQKTEALYFHSKSSGKPPRTHIRVGGTSISVGNRLKYLGLLLDGEWKFGHHFNVLALR
ncbi:uncharacterized protein [Anoplolepis gracilipes]|uniref:uncharacterized protein n=1 Tax=Anoplolepis gracilipes TaxID=354296 RepID=UPI003BA24FD4